MKEQIEKQAIEEMAKVIEKTEQIARDAHCGYPSPTMYAKDLYWHGYRKQSEGEWLPSPDGINPIRCNKCNMPAPFAAGENEFGDFEICRYPSNYCPSCGAKMKGGAE